MKDLKWTQYSDFQNTTLLRSSDDDDDDDDDEKDEETDDAELSSQVDSYFCDIPS